jgi:hypothetical protein
MEWRERIKKDGEITKRIRKEEKRGKQAKKEVIFDRKKCINRITDNFRSRKRS